MQKFCGFFNYQAAERCWNPWTGILAADGCISEETSSQWIWITQKDHCWAIAQNISITNPLYPIPTPREPSAASLKPPGALMMWTGSQAQAWSPCRWLPLRLSHAGKTKAPDGSMTTSIGTTHITYRVSWFSLVLIMSWSVLVPAWLQHCSSGRRINVGVIMRLTSWSLWASRWTTVAIKKSNQEVTPKTHKSPSPGLKIQVMIKWPV